MRSGPVPDNRNGMTVVRDAIQAEPVPEAGRNQRVDFDHAVSSWPEPAHSRNHEVGVTGMVVVIAASVERALSNLGGPRLPLTGKRIEILVDERDRAAAGQTKALASCVNEKEAEVILNSKRAGRIPV